MTNTSKEKVLEIIETYRKEIKKEPFINWLYKLESCEIIEKRIRELK